MEWFWMIVIAAGATLVQGWLLQAYTQSLEGQVVHASSWLKGMGMLMVSAAVGLLVYAHLKMQGAERYAPWVMAALLGGLGAAIVWVCQHWYIQIGDDFVQYHLGFGQEKRIDFVDIESCREVEINGSKHWRVKAKNGWKVDVPIEKLEAESLRLYVHHHLNLV